MYFECNTDVDINFHSLDCVNGVCKNKCSIADDSKRNYDWYKHLLSVRNCS